MKFFDYIVQDAKARYETNGFFKSLMRYLRLPSFKLLVNYRATQYILNNKRRWGMSFLGGYIIGY